MTVYKDGYTCPECGPVKAKFIWDNKYGETLVICSKCGQTIQAVIPVPISKLQWMKGYAETIGSKNSTPLVGGGSGPEQRACIPSKPAPAHPQEETI